VPLASANSFLVGGSDFGFAVGFPNIAATSGTPTVTGISPSSGPISGGTRVTITGTNLANAEAVDFGSAQITSFLSDTAAQITLLSPAGTGTVEVTVVTPEGQSPSSSADQFTYVSTLAGPTNLSAVSGRGNPGGTATLTATLTASGSPLAGKAVTFTLNDDGMVTDVGRATTDANGVATLTGVSLAGLNAGTYSGAVNAYFAGDSTYSASSASGTLVASATTLIITGEQPLFHRITNKKGKAIGKPVLTGFLFDFSAALNPLSATNTANYQVDTMTIKRVKNHTRRIPHPITGFSLAYNAASDSVALTFTGKQTFPAGGQITVLGGLQAGVTGAAGAALAESTEFTISRGGRNIGTR
jgi:hypothetical protein